MRFVAKLAVATILLVSLGLAQQQPTFRSQSELVVIPAVVTDHAGAHIANLKKEDFSVQENGVDQKITVLEEVYTTTSRVNRPAPQPNHFSNYLTGALTERRLTIIALDTVNTPLLDQARAKQEMLKFLQDWVSGGEPMSLVVLTRSGVKVIHDFTTDPKVLAEALKRARNRNEQVAEEPSGEAGPEETAINTEEQQLFQMMADAEQNMVAFQRRVSATMTLDAMQQIAQMFGGVPGRKSLLWASSGFPFSISDQTMSLSTPGRDNVTDILPLYESTWRALSDAQIAVYPVDLRGLVTSVPGADIGRPSRNFPQQAMWNNSERLATFQIIAQATGGRAFYNTNDLAGAFRKAADDSSSYYMIAYYRDAKDNKPGWRKLKVAVHRPGAQVRARSGYFVQKPTTAEGERRREMMLAVLSPIDYTGIAFTASWKAEAAAAGGKKRIPYELILAANMLQVDSADNNHITADFFAVSRTPAGQTADQRGQTLDAHLTSGNVAQLLHNGITYENVLELSPGEYTVRFVVRDQLSGRMGTVSAPLKVE